jgi:deazaflavin-dependent oxidoreductase (nitroreductase family)
VRSGRAPRDPETCTLTPVSDLRTLNNEEYCYLTTTGRVTGRPHEIEIWFSLNGDTIYMLSDSHSSDWVENLRRTPEVTVRIAGERFEGRARLVEDPEEDELARSLLIEKYERNPGSLSNWRRTALPVAVDLALAAGR